MATTLNSAQLLKYAQSQAESESPNPQELEYCQSSLNNLDLEPESRTQIQAAINSASEHQQSVARARFPGLVR